MRSTPEITEDGTFTQMGQFQVESARQEALIAAIVAEVERCVRRRLGFMSSTFHASLDGRHVLNYAQWRGEADFRALTEDPESERLSAAIRAVGPTGGPQAVQYRVVRGIEPASSAEGGDHG